MRMTDWEREMWMQASLDHHCRRGLGITDVGSRYFELKIWGTAANTAALL